jgi:hypothetical protein
MPNPDDRRETFIAPITGRADDVLAIYRDVVRRYDRVLSTFSDEELPAAARLLQSLCDQDGLPQRRGT